MKVAMISDWYPPKKGGVETLVHELSKSMDKRPGVDVEVITQDFSSTFSFQERSMHEDGVKVRRLAGITDPVWGTYFHPELPLKIKKLFKKKDYDVIHTHHFFTLLSVLSTTVASEMHPRRKCVVATNHTYHRKSGSSIFKLPKFFASLAGKSADRIFVGSDAAAKMVKDITDSGKIRKVGYGVSLDGFHPKKESEEVREELGIDSGIGALFVGRLAKRKGLSYLFRALKKVRKEISDFRLVLVGEGPEEKTCGELVKKFDLKDMVRLEGFKPKDELQEIYASCDFVILPSTKDESFGRVIPEAMASGVPVLTTDIAGYREVFEDGAGFLIPPKDSDSLAEKMLKLSKDEKLREKLGRKGRKVATEKFNWDKIVDRTLEVYDEVISQV